MIQLSLVGIGTGNPDHLTRAAIRALNSADLILLPRKGDAKSDLIDLRREICAECVADSVRLVEFDLPQRAQAGEYLGRVRDWHAAIAQVWAENIAAHLPGGGRVALMVWGDPSLYDSSLRIAQRLIGAGMDVEIEVVPGITSLQALTAAHRIPLNGLGAPVMITTGRRLRAEGWPQGVARVAVMLDEGCAFESLPPEGIEIWWGAYLGMAAEYLISGRLADMAPVIRAERARLRAAHGWIMDIYVMENTFIQSVSG